MGKSLINENQTVSEGVYTRYVLDECALPQDFLQANIHRISRAYAAGEPIWMIAQELQMVFETTPAKPTKTPRSLAKRVVRF